MLDLRLRLTPSLAPEVLQGLLSQSRHVESRVCMLGGGALQLPLSGSWGGQCVWRTELGVKAPEVCNEERLGLRKEQGSYSEPIQPPWP